MLDHERAPRSATAANYGTRNSADDDSHGYVSIVADAGAVERVHRVALDAGGHDDGGGGERPEYHRHHFAAFVRDPGGNRVEAVCHRPRVRGDGG